jgi:1,4-alpha-glucan branching enzyme
MGGTKKDGAKRRVLFRLPAPEATQVSLVGDFNGWDPARHKMKQAAEGLWTRTVSLSPGSYQYRFVVDSQWWNDPANQSRVANTFGSMNDLLVVK